MRRTQLYPAAGGAIGGAGAGAAAGAVHGGAGAGAAEAVEVRLTDAFWLLLLLLPPFSHHASCPTRISFASFFAAVGACAGAQADVEVVSLSEMVAPQFQEEAHGQIQRILHRVCPWAEIVFELERTDDLLCGGSRREADMPSVLGYFQEKAGAAGTAPCTEIDGVSVLRPSKHCLHTTPKSAVILGRGTTLSPPSPRAGERPGKPRKYFVVEAYSGFTARIIFEKLNQLDTLLGVIVSRFADRHSLRASPHITSVIGAAALVLPCGCNRRGDYLDELKKQLNAERYGDNVWELMRAGRFFIVVLTADQTPAAHATRIIAKVLAGKARLVVGDE